MNPDKFKIIFCLLYHKQVFYLL